MNDCTSLNKENKISTFGINEIYTFFLVVSPILFTYGTGVGSITLSDMFLMIFNVILLFKGLIRGKISVFTNLLPFLFYITILTLTKEFNQDVWMRTFRYVFYLVNIIFYVKAHFNFHFGVRVYRLISLISTGFLFLQIFFYRLLGVYIPGVIVSANLTAPDLYVYNKTFQLAQVKRFMSFFEEPSHFAIYILGYITILLFSKMKNGDFLKKDIIEFCFLSAGLALSTSILGVMVLGAMLSLWMATNLFKNKKNFSRLLLFIFVLIIAVFLISQTAAFEYFTNPSVINRQAEGRVGGYTLLNDQAKTINLDVFGRGMKKISYGIYLASYPLLIYYFGYFGLCLFIIAFIPYFKRRKMNVSTALLICLFTISIGSEILLGRFILIFLPFIIQAKTVSK